MRSLCHIRPEGEIIAQQLGLSLCWNIGLICRIGQKVRVWNFQQQLERVEGGIIHGWQVDRRITTHDQIHFLYAAPGGAPQQALSADVGIVGA